LAFGHSPKRRLSSGGSITSRLMHMPQVSSTHRSVSSSFVFICFTLKGHAGIYSRRIRRRIARRELSTCELLFCWHCRFSYNLILVCSSC
jgi:hypothetical protein